MFITGEDDFGLM